LLNEKPEYTLSLRWETVEQTINKLREFCVAVQNHHIAEWKCEWSTDEMEAVDDVFDAVMIGLTDGSKYNQLRFEVLKRGTPRIEYDVSKRELRLLDS
jgi:hypothetical protein